MSNLALKQQQSQYHSNGGRLVASDGRCLPLKAASLSADAKAGIIRVVLEQRFVNPYAEPLQVTYQMALPADGAVSGFAFRIGEERIVGEVDTKRKARERFEEAILDGRTAALLDQERSSLFTQAVGNIPPHAEVVSELTIDQKLLWLPDGAWEWRFPTVVAPRYLGEPGRVVDAAAVTVDVADAQLPVKLALKLSVRDQLSVKPHSPSHPLHAAQGIGRHDVTFADEAGAALDRDVVVRWQAAGLKMGAELDLARPISGDPSDAAFGLLTLVPPTPAVRMESVPRDLIVLLDTSGSMGGQPLDQAKRVVSAMIDTLHERDRLELIEFSNEPRRWKWRAQEADPKHKAAAQAWLAALRAGGGTEMASGMIEALKPLRKDAQRQVVLITDGLIGSEHEVLTAILERLPAGSRVHTVGVGSGVNRSLTLPAARAGRGVEVVIGLGEDAEVAAQRLLARTTAPLVTEVEVSGSALVAVAPEHPMDLFGGAPALLCLKLNPAGGELAVRGKTAEGNYLERLTVKPLSRGEGSAAVATLYAREAVEDLETRAAVAGGRELDAQVERLGLQFQISTRLTSWVAVSKHQTVDPTAPRRQEKVPQNLPFGMSAEGVGLRGAQAPAQAQASLEAISLGLGTMARASKQRAPSPARSAPAGGPPRAKEEAKAGYVTDRLSKLFGGGADDEADRSRISEEPPASQRVAKPDERKVAEEPQEYEAGETETPKPPRYEADEPAPPEPPKDKASLERQAANLPSRPEPAPQPRQRFSARLVLLKDGRLAVEFTFTGGALSWAPGNVRIELADGSFVSAQVDPSRTTTPHELKAGVTVLLALKVPVGMGQPVKFHLDSGTVPLLLEL